MKKQKFGKLRIVKYKKGQKIKRYNFARKPIKPYLLMWLIHILVKIMLLGRKIKITFTGGKKPKRPALILATHTAFNDFYMLFSAVKTPRINYVTAIDAYYDMSTPLMHIIGAICKRKFISDLNLMRNLKYTVDKLQNVAVIYPEARYSLDGTTSYLPESLGKVAKFLGVPVYVYNLSGAYVSDPQWNKYKQNKMPMEGVMTEIATAEEVKSLSVDELNARIKQAFVYDDWAWLKNQGNILTYNQRATNLNAILYQCPHCKTEFMMEGNGTTLTCKHCGKVWTMLENGELTSDGDVYFSHIPDWFNWQKQNVHEEVFSGKYNVDVECEVFTLPDSAGFYHHGKGKLKQNSFGTELIVNLYGEDRVITYKGTQLESVHIEYNYKGYADMLDFSIPDDSVWVHPYHKDLITKISLATEEIRDLAKINLKK